MERHDTRDRPPRGARTTRRWPDSEEQSERTVSSTRQRRKSASWVPRRRMEPASSADRFRVRAITRESDPRRSEISPLMTTAPESDNDQTVRIWQQNLNKSPVAQLHLLNALNPSLYDIAAIQEPHLDFQGLTRASSRWRVHYPDRYAFNRKDTRSLLFVNARLSTNAWTPIAIDSHDISAICLSTEDRDFHIYNIYNDGNHSNSINTL